MEKKVENEKARMKGNKAEVKSKLKKSLCLKI